MNEVNIKLPPKLCNIFAKPRGSVRYRCAYGGRGSGKSKGFAIMAAVYGATEKIKILCCREIQNSIKDSFHAELKSAIEMVPWLKSKYQVGIDFIRGHNGTEFLFKGLHRNLGSVKSISDIDICIIEEAEDVSEEAWRVLEPTIRKPKSEIWVIWNPASKDSPVDKRFIKNKPDRTAIQQVNWKDNPFFPNELNELRLHQQKTINPEMYLHIWEGGYLFISEAQIFKGKYSIQDFEIDHSYGHPLQGLDFGFSQDPTAANRIYIKDNILYIRNEASRVGLELDETAAFITGEIEGFDQYVIRADSARPESISYLSRHGLPFIEGVEKWSGSVQDGIEFMKSFDKIVVHPSCKETIKEFVNYSYKKDARTGDILPIIVDAYNHHLDACFCGDTLVVINGKTLKIRDIPETGYIKGFNGNYFKYDLGGYIKHDKVYRITTSNGKFIKCTGDHEFLTDEGWIKAIALEGKKLCVSKLFQIQSKNLTAKDIKNTKVKNTIHEGHYLVDLSEYTGKFGNFITEKSKKIMISIILMAIRITIILKILIRSSKENIALSTSNLSMQEIQILQRNKSKKIKKNAKHGIHQKKGMNGIRSIMRKSKIIFIRKLIKIASNAEKYILHMIEKHPYFAQINANLHTEEKKELITNKELVAIAAKNLLQTNTKKAPIVLEVVPLGIEPTYCLRVKNSGCFSLENDLIVSNCRYALTPMIKSQLFDYGSIL